MIGKDLCVEDLKLFKPHHIEALFGDEDSPNKASIGVKARHTAHTRHVNQG